MVFTTPVPEPGGLALLGAALAWRGCAFASAARERPAEDPLKKTKRDIRNVRSAPTAGLDKWIT